MAIETEETALDETKAGEVLEQLLADGGAALNALLGYAGHRLGLWRAMVDLGPTTSARLADATQTHERMVREWLAAQAASGYVIFDAASATFQLSPEHAVLLGADDSTLGGAAQLIVSAYRSADKFVEAMRTGKGLGWSDHHPDLFEAVERLLGPVYRLDLAATWIPALEGIAERLAAGGRVADVGCGHGVASLVVAEAFPQSIVVGVDVHEPSIETARQRARAAGVAARVTFEVASAGELAGEYDLVMFCECLHDMADPLGAARRAAEVLTPGGSVLLVESKAADRLEDNLHNLGRWSYAASTVFCTPCSLADDGAALGGQAGEARLRAVFQEAGLRNFTRVAEGEFNFVYEVRVT